MKIVIFKNNKKRAGKQDPDFTGTIQDENKKILQEVILWEQKSKTGLTYLSGKVIDPQPKQEKGLF
jgi:uncharacterized protein (DUF736 family)